MLVSHDLLPMDSESWKQQGKMCIRDRDEKVQAFIAESKNNRNRCYELSEQVTAQVATDGKMLQKYLDVQSRCV